MKICPDPPELSSCPGGRSLGDKMLKTDSSSPFAEENVLGYAGQAESERQGGYSPLIPFTSIQKYPTLNHLLQQLLK